VGGEPPRVVAHIGVGVRRGKDDGLRDAAEVMGASFEKLLGGTFQAELPGPKKGKARPGEVVELVLFLGKDGQALPTEPVGTS